MNEVQPRCGGSDTLYVTYTSAVVRIEARCTCGWHQLHELAENAAFDADRHAHEHHGAPS